MTAPVEVPVSSEPPAPAERPLRPRLLVGGALVALWTAFWTALGWGMVVLPLVALGAGVALVVAARRRGGLEIGSAVTSILRLVSAGVETGSDLVGRVPRVPVRVAEHLGAACRASRCRGRRSVSVRLPQVSVPRPPQVSVRLPQVSRTRSRRRPQPRAASQDSSPQPGASSRRSRRGLPRGRTTMQDALEAVSEGARQRRAGQPREAAAAYERAAAAFRAAGDMRATALALSNLGMSLARAGETDGAIAPLEEAVALLRELGDYHAEGQVLANLGSVHGRAGRQAEALDYWRDAASRLDDDSPERAEVEQRLLRAS